MQSVLACGFVCLASLTSAQTPPNRAEQTAEQLMALAKEQIADGETREAQLSILNALEAYERSEDAQPTGLIDAYLALGDAYQGGGEHELALGAYLEARGISRREFGLFDLGLVDVLRKMADSAVALGDSEQAIALHREAIDLVIRAHGARSIQAVEATHHFADWLSGHGHHREAATLYYFASRLAGSVSEQETSDAVRLLYQSADSRFRAERYAPHGNTPRKPEALISALRTVEPDLLRAPIRLIHPPRQSGRAGSARHLNSAPDRGCVDLDTVPPTEVDQPLRAAEILRDIGDWCVALDIPQHFGNAYVAAWNLLAVVEDGEQIRQEWFAAPTPLYLAPLQSPALSDAEDASIGRILLEFTVDEKGTADKIDVVASDPEGLLDRDAKRSIGNSRFRPSMEDGRFISSRIALALEFRYRPE